MSEINGENSRVSYSVKDLLGRIDLKLERIDVKLDQKADVKDVDALAGRTLEQGQKISGLENRIIITERLLQERDKVEGTSFTKKTFVVVSTLWAISLILQIVLSGGIVIK